MITTLRARFESPQQQDAPAPTNPTTTTAAAATVAPACDPSAAPQEAQVVAHAAADAAAAESGQQQQQQQEAEAQQVSRQNQPPPAEIVASRCDPTQQQQQQQPADASPQQAEPPDSPKPADEWAAIHRQSKTPRESADAYMDVVPGEGGYMVLAPTPKADPLARLQARLSAAFPGLTMAPTSEIGGLFVNNDDANDVGDTSSETEDEAGEQGEQGEEPATPSPVAATATNAAATNATAAALPPQSSTTSLPKSPRATIADPAIDSLIRPEGAPRRGSRFQLHPALSQLSLDRPRLDSTAVLRTKRRPAASSPKLESTTETEAQDGSCPALAQSGTSTSILPNLDQVFLGFSTTLTKIRNGKLYRRKFAIPDDQSCLSWTSEKKHGIQSLLMSQIIGVTTERDLLGSVEPADIAVLSPEQKQLLFSIEYTQVDEFRQTRHRLLLVADNQSDYDTWVLALKSILGRSQLVLEYMRSGATFTVCSAEAKAEHKLYLSQDCTELYSDTLQPHNLSLSKVHFVRTGQVTSNFQRTRHIRQFEELSFSLVFGDDFQSLDLIAHRQDDYLTWLRGLQILVTGAGESQVVMQKGVTIIHVHPKASRCVARRVYLSANKDYIFWDVGRRREMLKIEEIKELRHGRKTEGHKSCESDYVEERCFSIIYGDQYKELDLYIPNVLEFRDWMSGLEELLFNVQELPVALYTVTESQLRAAFERKAGRRRPTLNLRQTSALLLQLDASLNSSLNRVRIQSFFAQHSTKGRITADQLVQLYKQLNVRSDILELMKKFGSPDPADETKYRMSVAQLQEFLRKEQKVPAHEATVQACSALIRLYEPGSSNSDRLRKRTSQQAGLVGRGGAGGGSRSLGVDEQQQQQTQTPLSLSPQGLTALLQGPEGDLFNPAHDEVYMDMTRPLNEYFISSSHNTYLMADQLKGQSSVEMYIRALLRGCRSVEIDCWDGPEGQPIIYHGYTFTTKISFTETIDAINAYAFRASPYPVIISVENHCCLAQQKFMASYMTKVFGDKLVAMPSEPFQTLPSPEALKHKILIKCHAPIGKHYTKVIVSYDDEDGYQDTRGEVRLVDGQASAKMTTLLSNVNLSAEDYANPDDEDDAGTGADEEGEARGESPATLKKRNSKSSAVERKDRFKGYIRMHKTFTDLIVYTASVPRFEGFDHARLYNQCWMMTSLIEGRLADISASPLLAAEMVAMTKRQNTRVFPAGSRVNSSNFLPQQMWLTGCQMVALNWQTEGAAMQLNHGKFRANGGSGYVLKPLPLRDPSIAFDPHMLPGCPMSGNQLLHVELTVISAQRLPRARVIAPFVSIEVVGLKTDNATMTTSVQTHEGAAPMWNESFSFNISMPELAMLKFEVLDDRGKLHSAGFLCEASLPFSSLREGYRHVRLNGTNAEPLSSSLFVHVRITEGWKSGDYLAKQPNPRLMPLRIRDIVPRHVPLGDKQLDRALKEVPNLCLQLLQLREKAWQNLETLAEERKVADSGVDRRRSTVGQRIQNLKHSAAHTHLRGVLKSVQEVNARMEALQNLLWKARLEVQWQEILHNTKPQRQTLEVRRLAFEFAVRRVCQALLICEHLIEEVSKALVAPLQSLELRVKSDV